MVIAAALSLSVAAPTSAADLKAWSVEAPAPAPFALDLVSGGRADLSDYRGSVVLLHFFATWCEPCRPEMAALQRLAGRYRARRLTILAVSVAEGELRLRRFFATQPVSFPVALDRDRAIAKAWAVTGLPTTVVLDRNLMPRFVVEADYDWDGPEVDRLLDRLLAGTAAAYQPQRESDPSTDRSRGRTAMVKTRRELLQAGAALSAAAVLPHRAFAQALFAPAPGAWRNFEIVTKLEIDKPSGKSQAWIPVPAVNEAEWFRSLGSTWTTNAPKAALVRDPKYGAEMLHVEWKEGEAAPVVEVASRISTRDRATDFVKTAASAPLPPAERTLYTEGTELIPIDGIVKTTSDKITAGASTDVDKARAIYEWVVDNTYRNAATRGCGIGDIAAMLKSGNLGGKCADLNALYVGLARAAGLPARDVYGIRVAPSKFGYKSLGAGSEVITKAQHCRAEVYIEGHGWVPVDPADVRKVVLEEPPGKLAIDDPKVVAARKTLFGAWETNWLAYNFAHDVVLPGSAGPRLGFLMYPQAETAGLRLDCLDPGSFKYAITSKELNAA